MKRFFDMFITGAFIGTILYYNAWIINQIVLHPCMIGTKIFALICVNFVLILTLILGIEVLKDN